MNCSTLCAANARDCKVTSKPRATQSSSWSNTSGAGAIPAVWVGRFMRVTIASRRSDLARIQAYQAGEALRAVHSQIEINYSFHESLGDKNLNDPLWKMPEKGVFTQDFSEGLLRGDFDLVVHSWKDLAIEHDSETEIVATLPRADARDLLLARKDRWPEVERTGVMTVLTSSPRRAHTPDSILR